MYASYKETDRTHWLNTHRIDICFLGYLREQTGGRVSCRTFTGINRYLHPTLPDAKNWMLFAFHVHDDFLEDFVGIYRDIVKDSFDYRRDGGDVDVRQWKFRNLDKDFLKPDEISQIVRFINVSSDPAPFVFVTAEDKRLTRCLTRLKLSAKFRDGTKVREYPDLNIIVCVAQIDNMSLLVTQEELAKIKVPATQRIQ